MSSYTVTVIKTGNSYALRVPKKYVEDAQLKLGQKAEIQLPMPVVTQDIKEIRRLFKQLANMNAFSEIKDPVAWQREIRKDRPLPGRD